MQPSVVIVGGTHGNERTGVELVRHWTAHPRCLSRKNIDKIVLTEGNPEAVKAGVRYVDHDLNRCFLPADLCAPAHDASRRSGHEFDRARELVGQWSEQVKLEESFIMDLHTTTSAMGPTVILTEMTPVNLWVAAFIQKTLPELRVVTDVRPREESPFVNSLSPFGFCVEVGPVAQGTLSHQVLEWTRRIVMLSLDALDLYFSQPASRGLPKLDGTAQQLEIVTFAYDHVIDYPRYPDGSLRGYVHPERDGRDFAPVEVGSLMFKCFDGQDLAFENGGHCEFYWPIFIGEAAYCEKGIAMVLTRRVVQKWN